MKIAVLGGGNGSLAAAADLTLQGHTVSLWRRNVTAIETLCANDCLLTLKDFSGQHKISLFKATTEIGEAINGAELIVCPAPATAQPDIAAGLSRHLQNDQVVFMPPGSFGCYVMADILSRSNNPSQVMFAEAGTLPYLTRKHAEDTIAITTRATRLPTGVFPLQRKSEALDIIARAYPAVEDAGDALSGALMNAGPIIHPPLIMMNAGAIEHYNRDLAGDGRRWDIHNEGTQPAIRRVTTRLDGERIAVREALGYGAPHFPLADHYDDEREEWMYGNLAHDKLVDSGDWREELILTDHRYMREDIQTGLAFLVSVAAWAGVAAPTATGLLALGSAVCDDRFEQTGRTMKTLQLDDLSVDELQHRLMHGLSTG